MHHWHSENAYLYEERGGLSSINLKALRRQLGFHPPRRGRPPFFLDWSFERQFNSGSRTLSETISKLVLLMWGVTTLYGALITDKTTKLKICISMWLTVAWLQQQQNGTMRHFFGNERKHFWFIYIFICLHSPSDSSTFICDSSTFV